MEGRFRVLVEGLGRTRAAEQDTTVALDVTAQDPDMPWLVTPVRASIERGAIGGHRPELEIAKSAVVSGGTSRDRPRVCTVQPARASAARK